MPFIKHTFTKVTDRHIASINKDLKECIATDETGKEYPKLTLWKSDWEPVWANIVDGYTLTGEVKETEKNGFKNYTLYPERTNTLNPIRKSAGAITQAMKTKAANIEQAQERKSDAIKVAACARDATLLTVAWSQKTEVQFLDTEDLKAKWLEFRKWLTENFGDNEAPF